MPAELTPPAIEISNTQHRQRGTRTPRPYHHDGAEIQQHVNHEHDDYDVHEAHDRQQDSRRSEHWNARSGHGSTAGSESGTEADDERPSFVKALPAPHLRPRKGLKTGELSDDVLLTPSQLDDEGRQLSQDYFQRRSQDKGVANENERNEQEKLLRRRLAEFARRTSEVALMTVIAVAVLCGRGVFQSACQWRRELVAHVAVIVALIVAYPVKLSIVDNTSQARKLWQRFRVPASFDPATVLYPPLLPVLIALLVSPANSATVLPNIILGLSSLPQRLFPRSSRLGGINVLHWFVSIIPLIAAENTAWPSALCPAKPYVLKDGPPHGLWPETLVSLYPLHHALMQPLQYLTTTSLLISELHLLSVSLINLLLLAASPQTMMLKGCLWIGGVSLFVFCAPVLRWNVTLMRVPRWKYRRAGHTAEERKSLVDAVTELISLQRATAAFRPKESENSDADEDEPKASIKNRQNGHAQQEPQSAVEPRPNATGDFSEFDVPNGRPRRNTLPAPEFPVIPFRQSSSSRKTSSSHLVWYLHLTPAQAEARKWMNAAYIYAAMALIILIPVRYYVLERALQDQEPIGWAIGYLVGQVEPVQAWFVSFGLDRWIPLPVESMDLSGLKVTFPLDIPFLRASLGAANVRLLLIGYWGVVLLAGLLAVFSLTAFVEVDTRRKVFHGVMVAMMLPATFVDPCACALALILILSVFLLLEIIRAGQVLPLGNAIGRFVAPYVDGRDLRGPVVVSHIFLLIGCAVPLWFSLASIDRAGDPPWSGWELQHDLREVAMVSGVICVGMGDAAASLIGRRYGRHKWLWVGGKSLEGSGAFAVAVTVGLMAAKAWLVLGGWQDDTGTLYGHLGRLGAVHSIRAWLITLAKAVSCACAASFMEAVLTGANDNLLVPVALWLLVKGVRL